MGSASSVAIQRARLENAYTEGLLISCPDRLRLLVLFVAIHALLTVWPLMASPSVPPTVAYFCITVTALLAVYLRFTLGRYEAASRCRANKSR